MTTLASPHPSLGRLALVSTILLVGALASYAAVAEPFLLAGAALAVLVFALVLFQPLGLIALMLAIGPTDISFLTGGFKGLFAGAGGLDANGIRLIAFCAGFGLILLTSRGVRAAAAGKTGRWYVLFLLYVACNVPRSGVPLDGLRLFLKLMFPFLVFIGTLGLADTREKLTKLADVTLISAAIIAFIATPITIAMGRYSYDPSGVIRIEGVIGYSPFSFYLLMAMLLSLSRYLVRRQWPYLLLALVLGGWLVLTFTRITLLAMLLSVAAVGLLEAMRKGWRSVLAVAAVAAIISVPLVPVVLRRSLGYVPGVGELFGLMMHPLALYNSISLQGREVLWPIVFAAFMTSPIVGLGLGMSTAIVRENFAAWISQVVHNEYLRLATDTGIIGVALFAIAMFAWLGGAVRARRLRDSLTDEFALAAVGGIIAWAVISLTDNPFDYYAPFTQFVAFSVAGTLAAARFATAERSA